MRAAGRAPLGLFAVAFATMMHCRAQNQTTVRANPTIATSTGRLPTEAELAQSVRTLAREVSAIRGLLFHSTVPIEVQTAEQIARHFRGEAGALSPGQRVDEQLMIALGYIDHEGSRDVDALAHMLSSEAQGYYDTQRRVLVLPESEARLLLRPGPAGLDARATVVHELVHALQQQNFEARVNVDENEPALTEAAGVRLALLEGDATLAGLEWTARQRGSRLLDTPEMQGRIERWTERAQLLTEVNLPPYLLEAMEQPYETGTLAASGLYQQLRWVSINRALANVDLNSGQLLHPARPDSVTYLEQGAFEEQTITGMTSIASRRLGELELRLFLSSVVRKERAWALASAWRGDEVTLYSQADGRLAVRWTIGCDSPESAQLIVTAAQDLLARWERVGCPLLRGGSAHHCEASISQRGAHVVVARGR